MSFNLSSIESLLGLKNVFSTKSLTQLKALAALLTKAAEVLNELIASMESTDDAG